MAVMVNPREVMGESSESHSSEEVLLCEDHHNTQFLETKPLLGSASQTETPMKYL